MDEKRNIDELIREKFGDFSVEPPTQIWENIQGEMAARRRKTRMAYIGWISAAAVVVFALVAGWMLSDQRHSPSSAGFERQASAPKIEQQESAPALSAAQQTDHKRVEETASEKTGQKVQNEQPANTRLAAAKKGTQPTIEPATSMERAGYGMLASIRSFVGTAEKPEQELAKLSDYSVPENRTIDELSESDRLLIAANSRDLRPAKNPETGWVLGAHVAPGYGGHAASHSSQYSRNMGYNAEGGSANVGGGLSVQYKTSQRLRIESGVYYSQNGQSSGRSRSLFAMDASFDFAEGINRISNEQVFANVVRLRQGSIAMNSEAGVVNITRTPVGAVLAATSEAEKNDYSSVLTTSGEFSQVFDFVEIPLYMRYSIVDKKIGIDVMGGFNAGLVVGNNAYIENDHGRQRIGNTEDIRNLNLSGTVGMGVNYDLGRHLSLALEPRVSYYLNSISSSSDVDYKPYRFGLYTGIYYAF